MKIFLALALSTLSAASFLPRESIAFSTNDHSGMTDSTGVVKFDDPDEKLEQPQSGGNGFHFNMTGSNNTQQNSGAGLADPCAISPCYTVRH